MTTRHLEAGAPGPAANRILSLARQTAQMGLDLLFPPTCVGCGRVGSLICPKCLAAISLAPERSIPLLDEVCVLGTYEAPLSDAVQALKYHGVTRLAGPLAAQLASMIAARGWPVEVICPMPLHPNRRRERGYNQATLLAGALAQALSCPVVEAAERVRDTPTQTDLNARERRANVAGAFRALPVVSGCCVLLVDDVLTTGATLSACAAALHDAGAVAVYGAVVASAVLA